MCGCVNWELVINRYTAALISDISCTLETPCGGEGCGGGRGGGLRVVDCMHIGTEDCQDTCPLLLL